ncbi:uncharacterized protein O9250_012295 [Rhynochetos jubatus]
MALSGRGPHPRPSADRACADPPARPGQPLPSGRYPPAGQPAVTPAAHARIRHPAVGSAQGGAAVTEGTRPCPRVASATVVRFAAPGPERAAAGGSAPLPVARHSPPAASRRRCPEAGPGPRPRRGMKRFLGFGRKKKKEQPSPGSAGPPCPAGAYELRQKDLGGLHRAAASGVLAPLRQALKKCGIAGRAKPERTALHLACANGHVDVVTSLVENKWELNLLDGDNRSPLMKAVQCQQEECVAVLLQRGADVNLADADGNTALHLAVVSPNTSVAVLLLEHNASIDAQNKEGFTPLMLAVSLHHVEMVEFLLKEGADVHTRDQCERTPLMTAASGGECNLIKVLLQYGADVSHKDTNGRTAADYAVIHGHFSTIVLTDFCYPDKNYSSSA